MEEKKQIVLSLYKGLSRGNTEKAAELLAPDLEWWFHGPPGREHMMRMLTGVEDYGRGLRFKPRRVAEVGKWVVAEGWKRGDDVYWVHAWAVEGGVITQFREYFNTSVTVRQLRPTSSEAAAASAVVCVGGGGHKSGGSAIWESRVGLGRSMPGLVLTI